MKNTNKMDCMYRGELKKADKYTPLNVSKCHLRNPFAATIKSPVNQQRRVAKPGRQNKLGRPPST